MLKMAKICCFLQINKDSLNPFKCSEMILNYKGKMIDEVNRTEGDLQTTEDDLQTMEDDLQTTEDDRPINLYCSHHFRTLKWIQTGLVSLKMKILVIFRHALVIFRSL